MKLVIEFDRKRLNDSMFAFICLLCEIINVFIWMFSSEKNLRTCILWSNLFLMLLLLVEWYVLLFVYEDGKIVFLYNKIKYFPVNRGCYWFNKVIFSVGPVGIHVLVGLLGYFLAHRLGMW